MAVVSAPVTSTIKARKPEIQVSFFTSVRMACFRSFEEDEQE